MSLPRQLSRESCLDVPVMIPCSKNMKRSPRDSIFCVTRRWSMKFGLFYMFGEFGTIPQDQLFHEILEEIAYGEELGFDSVWLPEHHFAVYGMLGNPLTLAAAITQRTRRMQIGTAVMVLPFHYPLRLAVEAARVG